MSLPIGQWTEPYQRRLDELTELLPTIVSSRRPLRVLEAGAGATSNIAFPDGSEITGIDMSRQQLDRNSRLAARIVGDLQVHRFEPGSFDLVVCWNVLEHMSDPLAAVERMTEALAPGGILVIASPNLWSIKGLVTRFTPHAFHAWFHRRVLGRPHAGKGDVGPFRTFLSAGMAPRALAAHLIGRGWDVVRLDTFEGNQQFRVREKYPVAGRAIDALSATSRALSGGRADLGDSDYIAVFRRPSPA